MNKFLIRNAPILTAALLSFATPAAYADGLDDLFVPAQGNTFAAPRAGESAVRFNAEKARAMNAGDRARFSFPDKPDLVFQLDRIDTHANGDFTWIGRLEGDDDYRAIITHGQAGGTGVVRTPTGDFRFESRQDGILQSVADAGLAKAQTCTEHVPVAPAGDRRVTESANAFAATSQIDVLVLYSPGMSSTPSGATTVINQLIASANQAYVDSGVSVRLNLVGAQQIGYSDTGANNTALDSITSGTGVFAGVAQTRNQLGADLVVLLRPYNKATHGSCGVAWLLGASGDPMSPDYGFGVVSYGSDGSYYCDNLTLAHEIGHNMGSAHDVAHSSGPGAFGYSYGYGVSGIFGTIMSYIDPGVGKFSSPSLTCATGRACGTSTANNVLSLNNTRTTVEAFRTAAAAPTLTAISLSASSIAVGATATITPSPSGASLGTCASSNTAVATVSGSTITGVAAGTASITCGTASATITVTSSSTTTSDITITPTKSLDSLGRVRLSLAFKPKTSDVGKTANIYVAANLNYWAGSLWFMFDGMSWQNSTSLVPVARRTLSANEQGIVVLNYELAESTLKQFSTNVYLGYIVDGGSLVYGLAQSFQ